MLTQDSENKLIELFIAVDDFCHVLQAWQEKNQMRPPSVNQPTMSDSEMMTLLVFYQMSGYKCFQYYYQHMVQHQLVSYFPVQVSYERFVTLLPRLLPGLYLFLQWQTRQSQRSGCYFIDSKKLPVCDNRRIHAHRVFAQYAQRGKTSTGWFYGFKLHLVINQIGQIVRFRFTTGNVADNNEQVLRDLLTDLKGQCFGDRGYLSKLFEEFYRQSLQLVTKIRAKMKQHLMPLADKIKLRKRAIIESVNDILMTVFDLEHTRHRSPVHAFAHWFSALIAYGFYPNKPSVFVPQTHNLLFA